MARTLLKYIIIREVTDNIYLSDCIFNYYLLGKLHSQGCPFLSR